MKHSAIGCLHGKVNSGVGFKVYPLLSLEPKGKKIMSMKNASLRHTVCKSFEPCNVPKITNPISRAFHLSSSEGKPEAITYAKNRKRSRFSHQNLASTLLRSPNVAFDGSMSMNSSRCFHTTFATIEGSPKSKLAEAVVKSPHSKTVSSDFLLMNQKGSESPESSHRWCKVLCENQRKELTSLRANSVLPISASHQHLLPFKVPEPSYYDLRVVALTTAIPFVGFGIMDNAILIVAGDAIDTSLGVTLGISTMCAAAIGNIISDVAGIGLGTIIEDYCARHLNLPVPNISTSQRQLRSVRLANQFGCCVGIVIGCIIGMFPLLLIDSNKVQHKKREAHLDSIVRDVVTKILPLVEAARISIILRVDNKDDPTPDSCGKYLYVKYDSMTPDARVSSDMSPSGPLQTRKSIHGSAEITSPGDIKPSPPELKAKDIRFHPVGRGIGSGSLITGESLNILDPQSKSSFEPELDYVDWNDACNNSARNTKSVMCVPILDSKGKPIAVLQAVNKICNEGKPGKIKHTPSISHSKFIEKANPKDSLDEKDLTSPNSNLNERVEPGPDKDATSFTDRDVQLLIALASHISVMFQSMYEGEEGDRTEANIFQSLKLLKDYKQDLNCSSK